MFIDEATIYVKAGAGGNGCVSFRREKFVPKGGPDGGDGGRGGDVVLIARDNMHTLLDVSSRPRYLARNGQPGRGGDRAGKGGADLILELPCGTLVRDAKTGAQLTDLTHKDQQTVIARGGRGGRGNKRFATSTNQAPTHAEDGKPPEERNLLLTLKLIADVGLVGLPNAGKSSLLARVSAATPKIADYPFTTLSPVLGIVAPNPSQRMVLADIPGLIEGAHGGTGLGDAFLKHVERTAILVHLIDVAPLAGPTPEEAYRVIRNELASYSEALAEKPELIVANKMDLDADRSHLAAMEQSIQRPIIPISTVSGEGLPQLLEHISKILSSTGRKG